MPAVNSKILIINDLIENLAIDGALSLSLEAFKGKHEQLKADIIVAAVNTLNSKIVDEFFEKNFTKPLQFIGVLTKDIEYDSIQDIHNRFALHKLIPLRDEDLIRKSVQEASEKVQSIRQQYELESLIRDQEVKLKTIFDELEKRQKKLVELRRKNLIAKYRWETLRQCLEAIQRSLTKTEMESALNRVLQPAMNLLMVRISVVSQSNLNDILWAQKTGLNLFTVTLFKSEDQQLGSISFVRERSIPFTKEERDFLAKLGEAVSIAMDRSSKIEIAESFKEQWQATFNAVSDPVALIRSDHYVVQTNKAFAERSKKENTNQKCYAQLFNRDTECEGCNLGSNFRLIQNNRHYQVRSQISGDESSSNLVYVNQYLDVTQEVLMEKSLVDSAKMAELGTIGSSIAHEINNPLGGILSYLQIIKMDLNSQDPLYQDICEMEDGALRCRDIVQNLLGFSRSTSIKNKKLTNLKEIIQKVSAITDLQLKSRGFNLRMNLSKKNATIMGEANLLIHALLNVVQSGISHSFNRLLTDPDFKPIFQIDLVVDKEVQINIIDNSPESHPMANLEDFRHSLSQQIVADHGGTFSIEFPSPQIRQAKITFPLDPA